MASWKPILYLGIFSIFLNVSCERAKDKMYQSVPGAFCFKRLTATAEYGCTSSRSGDTGVLHFLDKDSDLDWLINKADAGPYVVVLSFNYFNRATLLQLKNSTKVSGIVLTTNVTATSFSPDDTCPNRYSGLKEEECSATEIWNSYGNSLMFESWGFPIIYIDSQGTVDSLRECFTKHNNFDLDKQSSRSLCSIELTAHMLAAVDTRTCIRRSMMMNNLAQITFCDPLGDWSIYLPQFPRTDKEANRSITMVIARLDGSSMFDNIVPGALSPVTGIVTLLMTAYYLRDITHEKPSENIVFVLFNGESYDYIGSSRMIYDMKEGIFPYPAFDSEGKSRIPPMMLSHVGLIVELDQLSGSNFYYHMHRSSTNKAKGFISALESEWKSDKLNLSKSAEQKLPPASIQRFIKEDPEIEGLVISNYDRSYVNKYYHSILDSSSELNYSYLNGSEQWNDTIQYSIAELSLALAKALLKYSQNVVQIAPELLPNYRMADELLHCYLEAQSCEIFHKATTQVKLDDKPLPLYVGVHGHNNTLTKLTGRTLAYLTGKTVELNMTSCHNEHDDAEYQFIWMRGDSENDTGVCIKTLMNYTLAQSPAFVIEDYDWASNKYSSWTESIWQMLSARIFLKPSKRHEALTISLGLLVLILSFVVVYFINTRASILFNHQVLGSGGC